MRAFTTLLTAAAFIAPLPLAAQTVPAETARIIAERSANSEVMRNADKPLPRLPIPTKPAAGDYYTYAPPAGGR